jgi:hypothetical protein
MTESGFPLNPPSRPDPERWVDEHGECLYRFALMRVRKPSATLS